MFGIIKKSLEMPDASHALKGRAEPIATAKKHFVNDVPLKPPYPAGMEQALFGMGCFWGAERLLWQVGGVYLTAVGYSAGITPNPTYEEVCTGQTGHNEVVLVVFDPRLVSYQDLLVTFWESHDPTQGMRQGNDIGTQYRSGIYVFDKGQDEIAKSSQQTYQKALNTAGLGRITTEILEAGAFYYAEDYHQQYLAKNPDGYCGIGGTNVACPVGITVRDEP